MNNWQKNENIPLIHNNYFNVLLDAGRFSQAEDYVEKIIKRDPRLTYRMDLGIVYTRSGDIAKADKYFRTLVKAQGEDAYKLKSMADYWLHEIRWSMQLWPYNRQELQREIICTPSNLPISTASRASATRWCRSI